MSRPEPTQEELFEAMTPDQKAEAIRAHQEARSDWFGWCQTCKARVGGTLKQIKEHRCGG